MTEQSRNDAINKLKQEMQNHVDLTNLNDTQLQTLITEALEEKIDCAREKLPGANRELLTLNFKEKKLIVSAVFEAIRGLGVLGGIIVDPDVTEIMIFCHKSARSSTQQA